MLKHIRPLLIAGASSIVLLAAMPALAQDANDPAVQQAFSNFQAAQDEATQQALLEACLNAGFAGLDDCFAAVTGQTPVEQLPPDEPPIEEPPPPEEPVIEEPPPEEPVVEPPPPEEPVVEPPPPEEPVIEEPPPEETPVEEPSSSSEEPLIEEPPPEEPVIDEPPPEEPVVEEPSSEEPVVDQPSSEEPLIEEPAPEEPVTDTPSSDEPAVEDTSSEPPPVDTPPEQPIADLPNADEPVDPGAVEVLPPEIAPEEAAPILDSIKDDTNSGDETPAPAAPEEPPPPPPEDDSNAQALIEAPADGLFSISGEDGEPVDSGFVFTPPPPPPEVTVVPPPKPDSGFIFQIGVNIYINNPEQERSRFYDPLSDEIYYEQLSRGRVRETITRPNGVMIVTIYDRYGDVLQRSKILPDGREIYLATYDPEEEFDFTTWRDPGEDLPPLILGIPARDYILDADLSDEDEVYFFLDKPPVEQVRRIYSIDEVKRSARLRDMVRRLEVGGLTFDSGKATIARSQVRALEKVATAMQRLLDRNPGEVFLIEGHTDAVGSAVSNLVLSDKRAATVARILTDFFDIPPENLATQGYGERYLKVKTDKAEKLNRRVTIKRITPLVSYEALSN